ncbi:MAG TPA: DUF192 domain-containing protein [Baekduia sp.]|nr:DUF192 domain-containing protein [Baekduia sp.]
MSGRRRRRRLATAAQRFEGLAQQQLPGGLVLFGAFNWAARRDGLSDLDDLPTDWGLHLRPCRAVHMQGMRFALDLVWLDRRGRPVKVTRGLAPGRFAACLRARSVVEVAEGQGPRFAQALQLVGDQDSAAPSAS